MSENRGNCPVLEGPHHTTERHASNQHWWPNQLNLRLLHQNSPLSDPMGDDFDYAQEFSSLDLEAVKKDIEEVIDDEKKVMEHLVRRILLLPK